MVNRTGIGLLIAGVIALGVQLTTIGTVEFNTGTDGWVIVFQAGILAVVLGVVTVALNPTTTTEVLLATTLGVFGQTAISLGTVLFGEGTLPLDFVLQSSILPLAPMWIGYMTGALRTVTGVPRQRRRRITKIGAFVGLGLWIGSLVLFLLAQNGESGFHGGFLLLWWVLLLIGALIGGGVFYAFWRIFGSSSYTASRT